MKVDKTRKHVFDVVSNSEEPGKTIGQIWWTGKTIESDVPRLIKTLKDTMITDKKFSDGLEFFNLLPLHYRTGYLTLKRIK